MSSFQLSWILQVLWGLLKHAAEHNHSESDDSATIKWSLANPAETICQAVSLKELQLGIFLARSHFPSVLMAIKK